MKRTSWTALSLAAFCALAFLLPTQLHAVQFPNLDPGYNQQIYAAPELAPIPSPGGAGMAWTSTGNLLTRNGSSIVEYLPGTFVHNGTNIHIPVVHNVAGLPANGTGMTNGLNGFLYTMTNAGLYQVDPTTWTATLMGVTVPPSIGTGYSATTLSNGKIAYSDNVFGGSKVYVFDPVANTNTFIFTVPGQVDGMVGGPGNLLAITDHANQQIYVTDQVGTLLNNFATPAFPDGLAFSAVSNNLYSNNNNGSITRYQLGPGFLGVPTVTNIAFFSQAYGDLATVGPDCAFYVSQFENGAQGGATPGVGTHWDNGVTNNEASIIRIGTNTIITQNPDGTVTQSMECFYTPFNVPEPGTVTLLLLGGIGMGFVAVRRQRQANA